MNKKTFRDDPALMFINTGKPVKEKPEPDPQDRKPSDQGDPVKPDPATIETKSRRLQLLMQPSLYRNLKAIAEHKGISVNELVHSALDEYAERMIMVYEHLSNLRNKGKS